MNSQRKIGALLSYFNIILKNLVSFIYTPVLLHYLGQSQYGLFQMTNSVMMSLSILSMGLGTAYIKFYISYQVKSEFEKIKKLNGLYLIIFCCISLISLIISGVLVFNTATIFGNSFTNNEVLLTKELMIILGVNLALTFPSSIFESNIIVNEQFKFQQARQVLQTLLIPLFAIPIIILGGNVLTVGVVQTGVTCFFLFLNARYCLRNLNMTFSFSNLTLSMLKPLLSFSVFILLNQVVDIINNNVPSFILGIVLGAKQVAIFSVALQIKNMFFMLSTSLSAIFVPLVNQLVSQQKSKTELTNLMIRVGRIQMNILFFVLGGFICLGKFFVEKWAGKENLLAYDLIIMMVLPSIIPLSQNVGIEIQRAMNKHVFRSLSYTIFAFLNLLITYYATNNWGIKGATLGYIFSILIANGLLMNWYYHKKMGLNMIKYWKNTLPLLLPFSITTIFIEIVMRHFPLNSYKYFVIYGLAYVVIYLSVYYPFISNDYEKEQFKLLRKKS